MEIPQEEDRIWDKTILIDTSVSEISVDSKTPRIFVNATQQVSWLL